MSILGTDSIGRDVLSRLIHGARVSLGTGLLVVILSLSFGMLLGTLAGYFQDGSIVFNHKDDGYFDVTSKYSIGHSNCGSVGSQFGKWNCCC